MSDESKKPKKKLRGSRRATASRFVVAAALAAAAVGLMQLGSRFGHSLFPAYRQLSQGMMVALSNAMSFTTVAVWDIALVALVAILLVALVIHIVRRRGVLAWLSSVCVIAASLLLFMTAFWGLNHYAPPLSEDLGLEVGEYSSDQLLEATQHYLDEVAALASEVPRDEEGNLAAQDFQELAALAGNGFAELSEEHDVFSGSTQPVKELSVLGTFLLCTGHNGIISPFTGEASVPAGCAVADQPFTMCHEVSHRCGIASEQEANFAAFLAGSSHEDARFRYSAYLKAFQYCYSALASSYPQRVGELETMSNSEGYVRVAQDINATAAYYKQYSGPLESAGSAANDAYLKAFDQQEGVRSYGLVADYLIAWHVSGRG